jgi:FO synthase
MWALIPLKNLELAKTRLAPTLTPGERRRLMLGMVRDGLHALTRCRSIEKVFLLSRDQACSELARDFPVEILNLEQDTSINDGLEAAALLLAGRGCRELLIQHGDLPVVSPFAIEAFIDNHRESGAAISLVSCQHRGGTNAMIVPLPCPVHFAYGEHSFMKHVAQAEAKKLPVNVFEHKQLALDLDNIHDLLQLTLEKISNGYVLSDEEAIELARVEDTAQLMACARQLRDAHFHNVVTYSKKVFIPLTQLCRDVCHYCTFAQVPRKLEKAYLSMDEVLAIARKGAALGCKEALFTLGERPELRYSAARDALSEMGYESTLHYLKDVARKVFEETGLLPHLNPGCMSADEMAMLRPVSPSMGIMLESTSTRLCEKGLPHYGSPDKDPARRLATLEEAGKQNIPFTTGILIGIGETRRERIESLLAIREIHQQYGHIQEIIVQNFRAKPDTLMANAPEPDLNELLWTIAIARLIFGSQMAIQAPPNLSPGVLPQIINAGINDWGGVSPLTPDYVNPEAPWPHLGKLRRETETSGKLLEERLTIYPAYAQDVQRWADKTFHAAILAQTDADGFPRSDNWLTGTPGAAPMDLFESDRIPVSHDIKQIVAKAQRGAELDECEIVRLFQARGSDFVYVCNAADLLRKHCVGDPVTYVVNRNINYTNICYFKCSFCAFSKGKTHEHLRGKPYDISLEEIQNRVREARLRGATEVCMQGGIHPDYTGAHYLNICEAVKTVDPQMHIHAFSPLEIFQGAATLGISVKDFLQQLRQAGLGTLPGTAAEILHDEVRAIICPDKINTQQWLDVIRSAHELGIRTTATIMFGHVDHYPHWAAHLLHIRRLQKQTGGFTEFVPLPFVGEEAPMFKRGRARKGPTFRECILMHAISRLVLYPAIRNIQASWVKMGLDGVLACLQAGANDVGGTLMDETITRSAGATHGLEQTPETLREVIRRIGRTPIERTTLYTAAHDQPPNIIPITISLASLSPPDMNPAETLVAP